MRRAFTMIESVVSVIIVGVMMVAAMRTVAASRVIQFRTAERAQASMLAQELLTEVMGRAYEDAVSPVFGLESGEPASPRAGFDDVDDYNGWKEDPVKDALGSAVSGLGTWSREVVVSRVLPANVTTNAALDTGAKRVSITIRHLGSPVLTLHGVRTSAR